MVKISWQCRWILVHTHLSDIKALQEGRETSWLIEILQINILSKAPAIETSILISEHKLEVDFFFFFCVYSLDLKVMQYPNWKNNLISCGYTLKYMAIFKDN